MRGIAAPQTSVLRGVVLAIAVLQSVALGLLARRGSWLSDDLEFLVQGSRGFTPAELLTPVNDHIAPGLRFVYAVFAELAPLNHDFTVGWRIVMQAAATTLLGLLLLRLLGSSWWVVAGTIFYAVTPLSMPSFMSLSSGVNNLSAHVFGLLLLHATIDWYAGHKRRAVAYGPLALLLSLACWEKSALILVTALALALYLRDEPIRAWLRHTLPFVAGLVLATIAFGILYLAEGNPSPGRFPSAGKMLELIADGFGVPLAALAGGPWSWSDTGLPMSLAEPPVAALATGGALMILLLSTAWRRDRRALLLWGSVAVYVVATVVVVGYGRFAVFGPVITGHFHYWSDLSIPLTLAIVLSARQVRIVVPAVALSCLLVGAVVSDVGFATAWGRNPAKEYFATVRAELDRVGPTANLWDTSMPQPIVNGLMADTRLSPVLRTAGIPFELQAPGSEPMIVDDTGHLRPAQLAVWARDEPVSHGNSFCNLLLRGTTPLDVPLAPTQNEFATADWFMKVEYFSNQQNAVSVELVDATGHVAPLPAADWPAGVGSMYFGPSQRITATTVRLRSADPATNLCVAKLEIGLPR